MHPARLPRKDVVFCPPRLDVSASSPPRSKNQVGDAMLNCFFCTRDQQNKHGLSPGCSGDFPSTDRFRSWRLRHRVPRVDLTRLPPPSSPQPRLVLLHPRQRGIETPLILGLPSPFSSRFKQLVAPDSGFAVRSCGPPSNGIC